MVGWTVGSIGLLGAGASYAGYAIPGVGQVAGIYGILRTSYELGAKYGPGTWYGKNDDKWFE